MSRSRRAVLSGVLDGRTSRVPWTQEISDAPAMLDVVWLALRANIRQVLESVTLTDVVSGSLPEPIGTLAQHPDAALQRENRFEQGPGPNA